MLASGLMGKPNHGPCLICEGVQNLTIEHLCDSCNKKYSMKFGRVWVSDGEEWHLEDRGSLKDLVERIRNGEV